VEKQLGSNARAGPKGRGLVQDRGNLRLDRERARVGAATLASPTPSDRRVTADGKYLALGETTFRARGVTYGSFRPRADGAPFPEGDRVEKDFRAIAAAGLNTVRVYGTPPSDVLELARAAGLRLLVGVHYEDWRYEPVPDRAAQRRVRRAGLVAVEEAMEQLAGDPAVLAVSIGNEVPAEVVRVHGIRAVTEVLTELVERVHDADADMLATYTNFPSTEFLAVDGQNLVCFNVFLERPEALRRYVRHLQVVAGDLPLVVAELGLAADLHGDEVQAASLASQLQVVEECGLAGATVFAWTDEWNVGGSDVDGWGFGITDAARRPKAALEAVSRWARSSPRDLREEWPRVSVVVCAHNAAATIEDCLASLVACEYPDLEVIVCDDGSTDATRALVRRYPVRLLELSHGGLSRARNRGVGAATGDVIAFLDADATCHPEWPYHLVLSLEDEGVGGTGGPNLPVPEAGLVERAVAASPGGPIHVLITDDRAEHVPGCNMAFRKDALQEIGYFDPIYEAAGDDVDVCWKLLDRGHEIAFSPQAQVLHRRRGTVRAYLRQQLGYGKAERLMASRHRHRFNGLGQARWAGFIYGGPRLLMRVLRPVVYHGSMGTAPFQPVVGRRAEAVAPRVGALVPLFIPFALLGLLAPVSLWWLIAPALVVAALTAYGGAVALSVRAPRTEPRPLAFRLLVGLLHVVQPLARAWGRVRARAPEAVADGRRFAWLGDRTAWLDSLARDLAARGCHVRFGEGHDGWDLEARRWPFVRARVTTAVLWRWTPSYRVAYRPRAALGGALAAVAALVLWSPTAGAAAAVVLVLALLVETAALVRAAREAVRTTTEGARSVGQRRAERPADRERRSNRQYARDAL
jgi:GT2 family glycosyltransferase/exo-beta-1,3-glucanase (GH17 family)